MDGGGADLIDRMGEGARAEPQPVPAAGQLDRTQGRASTRAREATPLLSLDGFDGPLERLLTLARAQQIDLSRISLTALLDQLEAALQQAPVTLPLVQKGDWVVMAAWLLQLRSRFLLPADTPAQQDAVAEADELLGHLVALQAMQALAGWLERRPQLGLDVFGRGKPEVLGVSVEPTPDLDIIEFLWASLALFDDGEPAPDTTTGYSPPRLPLYPLGEARTRILRLLAEAGYVRTAAAGSVRRCRQQRVHPRAAATLGLVQHTHRQPGTGQAGRCGGGAGKVISAHPSRQGLMAGTQQPAASVFRHHPRSVS